MINLLILLLIFCIIITIGYLIYKSLILSNKIVTLRTKLLLLELDLIDIDRTKLNNRDRVVYTMLSYSIKSLIDNLSNINFFLLYITIKNKYSKKRYGKVEKYYKIVSTIESKQLRDFLFRNQEVIFNGFKMDIKEWTIWLFPIVLAILFLITLYVFI